MRIRLSSNESPFGPSPRVIESIRAQLARVHRYPDDQSEALRTVLADHDGVEAERILVGNGSAGLLMDLIGLEHRRTGGSVVAYERAFIVYRLGAATAGARYVEARLGPGFTRDPAALIAAIGDDTAVVCLDNPGNPTGRHLTAEGLRELVEALPERVTLVLDEAYHHFASGFSGYRTAGQLGLAHPRLLVLHTFSKAYALAGLRVGYVTGEPDVIAALEAARTRFDVNAAAQAAAVAALRDHEHLERAISGTIDGRARMVEGLQAIGADIVAGLGNFVLLHTGGPAAPVIDAYAARGIGVRGLAPYGLAEHVRVSVGTRDEVDEFLAVSADVLSG